MRKKIETMYEGETMKFTFSSVCELFQASRVRRALELADQEDNRSMCCESASGADDGARESELEGEKQPWTRSGEGRENEEGAHYRRWKLEEQEQQEASHTKTGQGAETKQEERRHDRRIERGESEQAQQPHAETMHCGQRGEKECRHERMRELREKVGSQREREGEGADSAGRGGTRWGVCGMERETAGRGGRAGRG
jgi:hypothetical protein